MPYLPASSNCRQLFCTDVVIWSYTTVPVAFRLPFMCIFTKLAVQERYLPMIRVAGTPLPCVPSSQRTVTTADDDDDVADTGAVTLTRSLTGNSSFLATAADRGLPRRQTTVPVYVYPLPANRHEPRFIGDRQAFTATVPEDRPVGYRA